MNIWFTLIFAVLIIAVVVVEVIGVQRKGDGDTITENWRWVRDHSPPWGRWVLEVFTAGLLMWAIIHFLAN